MIEEKKNVSLISHSLTVGKYAVCNFKEVKFMYLKDYAIHI